MNSDRDDLDALITILIGWALTFTVGAIGAAFGHYEPFVGLGMASLLITATVVLVPR